MAQNTVKGSPKSQGGQLECIRITFAENGFQVSKSYAPKIGKGGSVNYQPDPKPMVFTDKGAATDYVEECMGERETKAHEAGEAAGKY